MYEGLKSDLDRILASARRSLVRRHVVREIATAAERAPGMLLGGILFLLAWYAGVWLFTGSLSPFPAWLLLVGVFGPPVAILAVAIVRGALRPIGDGNALAAIDRELDLEGRLTAAAAFLPIENRTPFMEAAMNDAATRTQAALDARLDSGAARFSFGTADRIRLGASLVLVVVALLLPRVSEVSLLIPDGEDPVTVAALPAVDGRTDEADERLPGPDAPPRSEAKTPPNARPGARGEAGPREDELTDHRKETRGRTAAGRPSSATAGSGRSQSRGQPSNQEQASRAAKKKTKPPEKKAKKKDRPEDPNRMRPPEKESGATAGRGLTSGAGRSPAATEWKSRDQVTAEEEEDLEDDEEVEDEFEESAARGGVQPQLRDRKPPANRDLSIGFGNQKNPDANGRGGPSQRKKSRGVATLVLGVPIPDHVKGKPNPGKTKTTQERVQPQPDDAPPVPAEERTARRDPIGHLAHPALTPWMRALVKTYFKALRESKGSDKRE